MKRYVRSRLNLVGKNAASWIAFASVLVVYFILLSNPQAAEIKDSCIDCHSNPDFLVTNKKLYTYFQDWKSSIHHQEGVNCDDCHGGQPDISDKKGAHGVTIVKGVEGSAINFKNVPGTCGQCHAEIYKGYVQSQHFEHLITKNQEKQGPNCVTCHGSTSTSILNVNTVKEACTHCHNNITENRPDIPKRAEYLLNKFLSIHRLYRYVTIRGNLSETKDFLTKIDAQISSLSTDWHTFDLKKFEQNTRVVLDALKEKRNGIRKQIKK